MTKLNLKIGNDIIQSSYNTFNKAQESRKVIQKVIYDSMSRNQAAILSFGNQEVIIAPNVYLNNLITIN